MNDMLDMHANMKEMEGMKMSNQIIDMNTVMYPEIGGGEPPVTLNYGMLKAVKPTTLLQGPTKLLNFELTGNMNRYVWSINNKTVSESDKILINHGENVRIILYNNSDAARNAFARALLSSIEQTE